MDRTKGNCSILVWGNNTYIVPVMLKKIFCFSIYCEGAYSKMYNSVYSPTKSSTVWLILKCAVEG